MHMTTLKNFPGIIRSILLRPVPCGYGSRILPSGKLLDTFRIPQISYQSQRCFLRMTQKTEAKYKLMDNIANEYELIYRAPLVSYMKLAQSVSSISIIALSGIVLYKILKHSEFSFPLIAHFDFAILGDFSSDPETFIFLISSFLLLNLSIYSVVLRYPYRIYYNRTAKSYICVLAGLMPFHLRQISFKNGDIMRRPSVMSLVLPWRDAIFKIERRTLFIVENYFKTPADFSKMLSKL